MTSRLQDLRHGLRALARAPGSAAIAVVCLAIGIGASTTVFSLANGLFLRPLPGIEAPDRVVMVEGAGSYPNVRDLQRAESLVAQLSGLAGFLDRQMSLLPPADGAGSGPDEAVGVLGQLVSGSYFEVLGSRPAAGRLLRPEDEVEARSVAVLGHVLWMDRFDGDPGVVGRTVRLNGAPLKIVGVAPPGFIGTFVGIRFDIWAPLSMAPTLAPGFDLEDRAVDRLETVARLRPATTPSQARAALEAVGWRLETDHPEANRDLTLEVGALTGFDPETRGPALGVVAVLAAVALLLHLTACLNVANLLLARAAARQRELGIRLALGAGRARVVLVVVTESVSVALAGGALGLVFAVWGAELLHGLQPPVPFALAFDFSPDGKVLAFGVLAALASGLVAGLPPALQVTRARLLASLGEGGGGAGRPSRMRSLLVIGQVAASMVLLVVAGLFLRTLGQAAGADPGFATETVEIAPLVDLRLAGPQGPRAQRAFRELEDRVAALPGVEVAGLSGRAPLTLRPGTAEIRVPGHEPLPDRAGFEVGTDVVTPGFFDTLQIPVLAGRGFTDADREGAAAVAVVNRRLAERFWPEEGGVGRRLVVDGRSVRVVGVVGDVHYRSLGEAPGPFLYLAHGQQTPEPVQRMNLFVRRRAGAPPVAPAVRSVLREVAPSVPAPEIVPLRRFLGIAFLPQRVAGTVSGILGALIVGLAGTGLYGLMGFDVSRRVREIGIRMALGSSRRSVLRLILRRALALVALGVVAGSLLALGAAEGVSSLLFGIDPADPVTFLVGAALLLAMAVLGSWAPALRASRVDPMEVLRRA